MFIHGAEGGDHHAEGDDGEKQKVLDGGYNEEMRPELRHPVGLAAGAAVGVAVGEQVPMYGELEPDETAREDGKSGKDGRLAPYL